MQQESVVNPNSGTLREMLSMAAPLIVSFLTHSVMGITDMFIMGSVGTAQQGAVGMGAVVSWAVASFFVGTFSAVSTFVAQYHGAGQRMALHRWVTTALWLVLPLFLVFAFLSTAVPFLVRQFGTNEELAPHVIVYTRILLAATPVALFNFIFVSFFRGIGDTVTPMLVNLVTIVFNILIDIVLVFGYLGFPAMGIAGAATASVCAMTLSAVIFAWLYFGRRLSTRFGTRRFLWPDIGHLVHFLRVGVPIGTSWVIEHVAFSVMTIYVSTSDSVSMAAHAIAFQLNSISFMPAVAISVTGATLVGQYLGANRLDLAKRSATLCLRFSLAMLGTVAVIFLTFKESLIELFNTSPEVIEKGGFVLTVVALFQLFDAIGITVDGVFRGAGATVFPMVVRVINMAVLFIPFIFILGHLLDSPLQGAWFAALGAIALQGVVMLAAYSTGKWARPSILESNLLDPDPS